jgi:prepilin-type N-terminal cleavage/methylation domain-containing protein
MIPYSLEVYCMRAAFSLIELSIVLVILGLLTGGILTGQNLIRAAELRSVTTEFQTYQTAVMTFRDKYFAIPGDMRNATDFWEESASGASCATSTAAGTCNGDGSGTIDSLSTSNERYRFWQHLTLASLIEGGYSGVQGSGSAADSVIGENVPASKSSNAGWSVYNSVITAGGSTTFYAGDYGNYLIFGADGGTSNTTNNPALKPEEAWNIDTKIDDGKPGAGKIIARYWNDACATASSNTDYDSPYKLTDDSIQCALFFRNAF